jgi:hypothetical protein
VLSQQPIIPPIIQPIPVGRQQTESAPPLPPQVQGYEAPNATLFIPPPEALPIGKQQTASAPIWTPPIGIAVGWTIPPDLLPPAVIVPPPTGSGHGFEMGGEEKPRRRNLVTIIREEKEEKPRQIITAKGIKQRKFKTAREEARKIIEQAVEEHAKNIAPQNIRYASVRAALKPLQKAIGSWDWVSLYQRMYADAIRDQIALELLVIDRAREAEEEEILMSILLVEEQIEPKMPEDIIRQAEEDRLLIAILKTEE